MQRAHFCALWGLGMMLASSSTHAGQVDLSLETRIGGDSNVFRSEDPIDDGTFDVSPRLGVRDVNDDVDYAVFYSPTHRSFFKTSGIDGVDHRANGRLAWAISPTDELDATTSYYNGRQFLIDSSEGGSGQTLTVNDRERIRISDTQLGYRRLLSQRLTLGTQVSFSDFDASGTSDSSQTDSRAYTGKVSLEYALSPRLEVGLSGSGRRRENRAVGPFRASTRTDVWDVMASISYAATPSIDLSIQAGPSFIRQQQVPAGARDPNSPECVAPPDLECARFAREEANDTTFFAAASARKNWRTSDVELSYVRSEARSGNVSSSSSINDQVELAGNVRLDDVWTLRGTASWNRYEEIASRGGSAGGFELTAYRTTETVEFALTRRILVIGQYSFSHQKNEFSAVGISNEVFVHVGFVGLRYTFEPLSY